VLGVEISTTANRVPAAALGILKGTEHRRRVKQPTFEKNTLGDILLLHKPHSWSYLASRVGHLVPVWRPYIGIIIPVVVMSNDTHRVTLPVIGAHELLEAVQISHVAAVSPKYVCARRQLVGEPWAQQRKAAAGSGPWSICCHARMRPPMPSAPNHAQTAGCPRLQLEAAHGVPGWASER
jgi:hypothetical protein